MPTPVLLRPVPDNVPLASLALPPAFSVIVTVSVAPTGYHTSLAANGEEALKLLDEKPERFDIVFSDVVMPGMDGITLGHEVRRRFPQLPFVLTSGYSHVLAEGPQGFELLHKPYSIEGLSRVLRRHLMQREPA